jgi:hypothetical protein
VEEHDRVAAARADVGDAQTLVVVASHASR